MRNFWIFSGLIFLSLSVLAQPKGASLVDSNAAKIVNGFQLIGNKTTKERIILREITFGVGDTLSLMELKEQMKLSRNNLLNTSLFNFITINSVDLNDSHVMVYINVTERWYTWPFPIFSLAETNFNSWWENQKFDRINYGIDVTRYNFRGRNEKLKLKFQLGFTEKIALQYRVPFFNKKQTNGFSIDFGYSRNHEVNYISSDNKRLFYKDRDKYIRQNYGGGISFQIRRKFFETNTIKLSYSYSSVDDTVMFFNPRYLGGGEDQLEYLKLSYAYIFDKRNNKNYTLEGYYFSTAITKTGFGLLNSNVDLLDFHLGARKFWKLNQRWYLAAGLNTWFSANNNQPYILQGGLGYKEQGTVRSYELNVIDAQQMGVAKSQLRYQLVAPRTKEFSFIPVNKFKKFHYSIYLGIFSDIGYAYDDDVIPNNDLANDIQFGSGVSIDWITYYDLVLRTEYSINKFGEHGLFLHFVSPI